MEFIVKNGSIEKQHSACIIVGVFETRRLSYIAEQLDKISNGYISTLLQHGELEGKIGQTLTLYHVPNIISERILLIGCGKERQLDEQQFEKIIYKTIIALNDTASMEAICFLSELHVKNRNIYWKIRQAVETTSKVLYCFNQLKSNPKLDKRYLRKIIFYVPNRRDITLGELAIQHSLAIAKGIKIAKDLSNLPANICNAAYMVSQASKLASQYENMSAFVINELQMIELGMNAYLAVGQGSHNESMMSVMEYKAHPNPDSKPIILVGKGLTFDSGGIDIKPANAMNDMKYDMCGAASVYGVMSVIANLQLPLNVIGILAGCENMPGGRALHPGDILTTMSGKTVEVLNTDAEGRLVLCDILTYVERFNPDTVIDIATLTGACVIALGHHFSGLMSNNNQLAKELLKASEQSRDRAWLFPLTEEYQEQLNSNFADIANIGCDGSSGGAITAAGFLAQFTNKYHWAHLDIAGTAWLASGKNKGATGRPVALLSQFMLNKAGEMKKINMS
ncbi:MAG: leucyl aminopeptidase [Candidatus Dasytiphilus stammeri]